MIYDGVILLEALGDNVCYTGVPTAYFKVTGNKLAVRSEGLDTRESHMAAVWQNNPHVSWQGTAKRWLRHPLVFSKNEAYLWGTTYKPLWLYQTLTKKTVSPDDVRPKLFYLRNQIKKRLIVNDEAGQPIRRGYPHMDALIKSLHARGWDIVVLRNGVKRIQEKTDALSGYEIHGPYDRAQYADVKTTIEFMATAHAYIGYESGLAHVAGALNIPYVMFSTVAGAEINRHPSCVFAVCACPTPCMNMSCQKACMQKLPNYNDLIVTKLQEVLTNG
jgi:ADP-heptose:LPS heptosyltransferase